MHREFYGLHEHPFQMTPDARLYFPSTAHERAHAHLTYGLAQHEGFIVVTGEVGAGKTTLIERLCEELDPHGFVIARISTTLISGDDMLRLVADAFGAEPEGNKAAVLRGIASALRHSGRRHLLIVDEAQGLVPAALEELRMLSNLTHPGQPPLQTLLMGQPQLRRLLVSPALAQLRQRVLASYHLGGLSREETHAYVMHRLRAVGWAGRPRWEEAALDLVHAHSEGLPRRINRLCARVLLSGALEGTDELTAGMVAMVAQELEQDLGGGAMIRAPAPRPAMRPEAPAPAEARQPAAPVAEAAVTDTALPADPVPPPALADEAPPGGQPDATASPAEPPALPGPSAAGSEAVPEPTPPPEEPPPEPPPAETPAPPPVGDPPPATPPLQAAAAASVPDPREAPRAAAGAAVEPLAQDDGSEPARAGSTEAQAPEPEPTMPPLRLPATLVPISFATAGLAPRGLLPGALLPPPPVPLPAAPVQAGPMLTSEAEVMFDTLTRPPPVPPVVPCRPREEEPERLFNWVFKLLPNGRARR